METISSNGFSVDQQLMDALSYLEHNHPGVYAEILVQYPEVPKVRESFGDNGAWIDSTTLGLDVEWSSWLIDAVEDTGLVAWQEGEPFAGPFDEEDENEG